MKVKGDRCLEYRDYRGKGERKKMKIDSFYLLPITEQAAPGGRLLL